MKSDWVFMCFLALLLVTALSAAGRGSFSARDRESWLLDLTGLFMHKIGFRFVSALVVFKLFALTLGQYRQSVELAWPAAIALTVAVNYLNYWNHRALHSRTALWNVHQVHHTTSKEMNVLSSFRNTLWAPLFDIYFWAIPLVIFVAKDPSRYLILEGGALVVVFWIHSGLCLPADSRIKKVLSSFLIQPENHAWHHSSERTNCNFGSLFNFWDRLHGTWYPEERLPESLGVPCDLPAWKKLLFPFEGLPAES